MLHLGSWADLKLFCKQRSRQGLIGTVYDKVSGPLVFAGKFQVGLILEYRSCQGPLVLRGLCQVVKWKLHCDMTV